MGIARAGWDEIARLRLRLFRIGITSDKGCLQHKFRVAR
jgi:hypothetical protein